MNDEKYALAFKIKYSGKLLLCEALLNSSTIKIYFNRSYVADIEYHPEAGWIQTDGTLLPATTIEEIGAHIDGQLD